MQSRASRNIIFKMAHTEVFCEDDPQDLHRCLRCLIADTDKACLLGQAAINYFSREATIDTIVTNFENAIDYTESLRD